VSLQDFFDGVAPALLGQRPVADVARELYANEPRRQVDAKRLAIYARFCTIHRQEAIEGIFSHTQAVAERTIGKPAWEQLIERFFTERPMREVEINANSATWPEFLATTKPAGLPDWIAPLADFEWWEWQTRIAPDSPLSPDTPLRLNPTVEVRPYPRDFVTWLDEGAEGEPHEESTLVIFWRDADFDVRRENANALELLILKSIVEGSKLSAAELRRQGLARSDVNETIDDLREAGILEGRAG
jgi:hypothetical protein